ncbi:MAG: tetratricopeptide repeat protein [Thermodesulfobacteria bacterium]|nr:tetratricopeptide repeat protein [Thermodesulfobacteriota bacterium]
MRPEDLRNLLLGLTFVGLLALGFQYVTADREEFPGEMTYREGNYRLEHGEYERALECFKEVQKINPSYYPARLGEALAYIKMNRYSEARQVLDSLIAEHPDFAEAWANRGILNDREGRYEEAVRDYEKALALKPSLARGPGFLYRLLYNIKEKPATIADRLEYLKEQLAKPPEERLLRVPEIDEKQPILKGS